MKFDVGILLYNMHTTEEWLVGVRFPFFRPLRPYYCGDVTTSADLTVILLYSSWSSGFRDYILFGFGIAVIAVLALKQSCRRFVVNAAHVSPVTATRHGDS